jgi:hypothetical protein
MQGTGGDHRKGGMGHTADTWPVSARGVIGERRGTVTWVKIAYSRVDQGNCAH